jgi:hypothetical protein
LPWCPASKRFDKRAKSKTNFYNVTAEGQGQFILEPYDLAGAEEALHRGGPAPAPVAGGAPSLADQVAAEAARLRRIGSPLAVFIADQLERLAQLVAFTGARTSQDFADRLEAHECALLAAEYDRGFRDGRSRSAGYCPR